MNVGVSRTPVPKHPFGPNSRHIWLPCMLLKKKSHIMVAMETKYRSEKKTVKGCCVYQTHVILRKFGTEMGTVDIDRDASGLISGRQRGTRTLSIYTWQVSRHVFVLTCGLT